MFLLTYIKALTEIADETNAPTGEGAENENSKYFEIMYDIIDAMQSADKKPVIMEAVNNANFIHCECSVAETINIILPANAPVTIHSGFSPVENKAVNCIESFKPIASIAHLPYNLEISKAHLKKRIWQ